MNKKRCIGIVCLFCLFVFSFFSCDNEEDNLPAKPVIDLKEVGYDNSKTSHPGSDLHLDAEIIADGLIKQIDLEIHQEDGEGYELTETFTDEKYVGVKNTDFHVHVAVPADAPLGAYHLHLNVMDQAGQSTTAESELTLTEGTDDEEEHDH